MVASSTEFTLLYYSVSCEISDYIKLVDFLHVLTTNVALFKCDVCTLKQLVIKKLLFCHKNLRLSYIKCHKH